VKYLVVVGLVGVLQAGYAEPKLLHGLSYDAYEDFEGGNEGCLTYAVLKAQNGNSPAVTHKLCAAGGYPRFVDNKDSVVVFADIQGGSGAGWGLYRYTQKGDQLERYDFNAREITFTKTDDRGVWLNVAYAVHNPKGGGYRPDRIEKWYWAFDTRAPVKK
jgi:hypothetical protein